MHKSCSDRYELVGIIYDSRGIFFQGKSVMHTKMFNEGQPFEGEA
jgi:hypothetical protein